MTPPDWLQRLLTARDDAPWSEYAAAPEAERRAVVAALKARVDELVRNRPPDAPPVAAALVRAAEGLPDLQPIALRGRALAAHFNGQSAAAETDYREALRLHEALGQPIEAARVLRTLVDVLHFLGRSPEALECGARGREIFLSHGERRLAAQTDLNVGNVWVRLDEYVKARASYEAARAVFRELKDELGETFADFNLAVVEMNANRVEESAACWQRARAGMAAAGMGLHVADCDYNAAYLESRRGRFAEALDGLDRARAAYEANGKPAGVPLCDLDAAEILLRLDARRDAWARARAAATAFEALGLDYERARAEVLCGLARARSGDVAGALSDLAGAVTRFRALGNEAYAAAAELQAAALQVRAGRPLDALPALLDARARLASRGLQLLADLASVTVARARLQSGDAPGALAELDLLLGRDHAGRDQAGRALDDLLLAEAHAVAAAARRELGELPAAVQAGRRAIEAVERSWSAAPSSDVRVAFFRDQHPIWVDLAWDLIELGQPAEALEALESGRARGLQEQRPERVEDEELAVARRRLDWLMQRRIDALFGPVAGSHDLRQVAVADEEITAAQRDVARRLAAGQPRGRAVAPVFGPDELLAAQGGGDDLLIAYLVAPRGVRAFVADGRDVQAVDLPADAAVLAGLRDRLWLHADSLRLGVGARPEAARAARAVLDELGRRLLAPLAARLASGRPVVVVPYGDLHDLPFHALRLGGVPLVARHDVATALSAGQLAQARRRTRRPEGELLLTAVPHVGLPRIAEEVDALRRAWGPRLQNIPPAELAARLDTTRGGGGMLHLAGHGLFEPRHPSFSAVCLGEGFLMAHDVRRMTLDLDLVVLSGCETGRRRRLQGEELLGLPAALLAAGTGAVVGNLWAVADEDACAAATAFHQELSRGATARESLARAQRRLHGEGRDELGWAALSLVGDPDVTFEAQPVPGRPAVRRDEDLGNGGAS